MTEGKSMNKKELLFLLLVVFQIIQFGCNSLKDKEVLPVYSNAKKIEKYSLANDRVKGVYFVSNIPYPSTEVLEFYDEKLAELDFYPFVEDYYRDNDRQWQIFQDGTVKGGPVVAQLRASWANRDKTKRINLVLKYHWQSNEIEQFNILPHNSELTVDLQIMPFVKLPPPENK